MVSKQTQTALGGAKNQRLREISVAKQAPKGMDPNKYAIKGTEDDPEILKNKYAEEPNWMTINCADHDGMSTKTSKTNFKLLITKPINAIPDLIFYLQEPNAALAGALRVAQWFFLILK